MRIYLIGYMGSGKSTLGRSLARHMGLQFVDMDHYLEKRYCKTVPQIFAEEGEEAFRRKERKVLEELSEITNVIVATGGGAPCFFDNMEVMNRTGKTIYLDIDPAILAFRLMHSKTERPLIRGKSKEELVQFIDETLRRRGLYYTRAKFQITDPEMDLDEITKMLGEQ